jgi:3'(2'), 5'-bisphosphate nucleotidase
MQSLAKTIRVSEFFSVAIQLCKESAQIINEVRNSGNLEKVMKGKDDPVTMADLKAQTTIFGGLRHFFPGITLVGEEDEEYKGEITLNFKSINKNLLPFEIFTNSDTSKVLLDEELNMNDVIVFVDPLDATLSFTKNELENITTLIGLGYQKRPYLGVIGHPFKKKDEANYEFNPRIYFSHRNVKKVFYLNADEVHSGVTGVLPWQLKRNNSNDESKGWCWLTE